MTNYYPTSIRLTPKLRQALRVEAKKEHRSLMAHIEYILMEHYRSRGIDINAIRTLKRRNRGGTPDVES